MAKRKVLFLLDSMALIYRAHFALHKYTRTNSKGLEVGALLGFANTVTEILQKQAPTHIVAIWDVPARTWHKDLYEDYKANRQVQPEAITTAIPYSKRLLEALGIPYLDVPGYEADDIIGTLQKKAKTEGFDVYMVSPDKDLGQLVGEHVWLYKPRKKGTAATSWGVKEVLAQWGIQQVGLIPDMLALWGDSSDNIPGVPKIGFKTAQKLINTYGPLEAILQAEAHLKPAIRASLQEYREQALLSKKLATIATDVPLPFDFTQKPYQGNDPILLQQLLGELEFHSLAKRLLRQGNTSKQLAMFTPPTRQAVPAVDKGAMATWKTTKPTYTCLKDIHEVAACLNMVNTHKAFCFDTETTSLSPYKADLLGIAIACEAHRALFIPVPTKAEDAKTLLSLFKPIFSNPQICKVGQNLKYDLLVLKKYGLEVKGPFFDTMVAHHLLEPNQRHHLTALANSYLNYAPIEIETLIGKKGKNQKTLREVPLEQLVTYACEDTDITLQIFQKITPLLKQEKLDKLFYHLEMPLLPVLANMEYRGIAIDKEMLKNISNELSQELEKVEKNIHALAGAPFNIASPKQLGEVLFVKLKIAEKPQKTPTGQYATSEPVLLKCVKKHPIIQEVLNYREIKKLKSTYVDALPSLLEADGRLHTSFQQAVVSTGRLSSTKPNLQNIPIRTERGRAIRKAFVPGHKDHLLLCVDYAQIELRIMTHFAQDQAMLAAFEAGKDIHTMTASQIFQVAEAAVTPPMRQQAKMVNFGIIYGISAFGLAQRLEIGTRDAAIIIQAYFQQFPGIKSYMDHAVETVQEKGYATTLLGRKRFLPDIHSRNATMRGFAERNAINMPIQGTAAELIQAAMIKIEAWIQQNNIPTQMILQVHDELIFEVAKPAIEVMKDQVPALMTNALPLKVPIAVTLGVGDHWLEAH